MKNFFNTLAMTIKSKVGKGFLVDLIMNAIERNDGFLAKKVHKAMAMRRLTHPHCKDDEVIRACMAGYELRK
jgi:hypothetical protein